MIKRITILVVGLLVAGCATVSDPLPAVVKIVEVKVPVIVYPTVAIPTRPRLEIDALTETDREKPGVVANAYIISLLRLRDYARELELLLEASTKKPEMASSP